MESFHKERVMTTLPNEDSTPIPEKFPGSPREPSHTDETPMFPSKPELPDGADADPYQGEVENEEDDPVGKPPRM
jgi:hypothetical protein